MNHVAPSHQTQPTRQPAQQPEQTAQRVFDNADDCARRLKALSNPTRLMAACAMLAGGPLSVGTIALHLTGLTDPPLSQSALSRHLAVMRHAGVVTTRREAQTIFYSLSPDARAVVHILARALDGGDTPA